MNTASERLGGSPAKIKIAAGKVTNSFSWGPDFQFYVMEIDVADRRRRIAIHDDAAFRFANDGGEYNVVNLAGSVSVPWWANGNKDWLRLSPPMAEE